MWTHGLRYLTSKIEILRNSLLSNATTKTLCRRDSRRGAGNGEIKNNNELNASWSWLGERLESEKLGRQRKQQEGRKEGRKKGGGARLLWKPGHFLVGLARETVPRSENVEQYLRSSVRKEQTREATSILTSDFVVERDELVK